MWWKKYGGDGESRTRIFSPVKGYGLEDRVSTPPEVGLTFSSDGGGDRCAEDERYHDAKTKEQSDERAKVDGCVHECRVVKFVQHSCSLFRKSF